MKSSQHDTPKKAATGISRRKFLKGAGLGTVGVAVGGSYFGTESPVAQTPDTRILGPKAASLSLTVNGKEYAVQAEPRETLAEILRNNLHLTGTKISCDRGACGACTVLIDDAAVCACSTLAHDVAGHSIVTIEGLMSGTALDALQQSFIDHDGVQCGFCTSGMIMSSKALLHQNPDPTADQVREALAGNLCRCGTYPKVFDAVLDAAKRTERGR